MDGARVVRADSPPMAGPGFEEVAALRARGSREGDVGEARDVDAEATSGNAFEEAAAVAPRRSWEADFEEAAAVELRRSVDSRWSWEAGFGEPAGGGAPRLRVPPRTSRDAVDVPASPIRACVVLRSPPSEEGRFGDPRGASAEIGRAWCRGSVQ